MKDTPSGGLLLEKSEVLLLSKGLSSGSQNTVPHLCKTKKAQHTRYQVKGAVSWTSSLFFCVYGSLYRTEFSLLLRWDTFQFCNDRLCHKMKFLLFFSVKTDH